MKQFTDKNKIREIKSYFPKHSMAVVRTMLILAQSILQLRTVCLYKCKDKVGEITGNKSTKVSSHYKRLLRFFEINKVITFCEEAFMFVLSLIGIESNLIVLDRTNWKIGRKNVNILTLGILFKGCFIPLCWQQLNKRGNSNFQERALLVNRFLRWWKKSGQQIKEMVMVADREFIGVEWITYLRLIELHFVVRLKENMYFELCKQNITKKKRQLRSYARKIEQQGIYTIRIMLQGKEYTIIMTKNFKYDPKEPYIFFLSDLENAKDILKYYTQRWKIECCFRHLKTNGFNLEDMNLKNDNKIMLMVAVVIITYALAVKEGVLKYLQKQIRMKCYKNGNVYLEMSIFRKGLEVLESKLNGFSRFIRYLFYQIKHASNCPYLLKLNKIVQ